MSLRAQLVECKFFLAHFKELIVLHWEAFEVLKIPNEWLMVRKVNVTIFIYPVKVPKKTHAVADLAEGAVTDQRVSAM